MSNPEGLRIAEQLIAEEAVRQTGSLDLADLGLTTLPRQLSKLHHLRVLWLGRSPRDDAPQEREFFEGNSIADLGPLAGLSSLQHLDCSDTTVADLGPVAGLFSLQYLDCSGTTVADLAPLAGLFSLQHLDCSRTTVADLGPIAGLFSLQHLDCSGTTVADLAPLAGLSSLQHLSCWGTQVVDFNPLAGLYSLQYLSCWGTQVVDLGLLAGLTSLQHLNCSHAKVADLGPLAGLSSLQHLNCSETTVADLAPLAGLFSLQHLDCSGTTVDNLAPLAGLFSLQHLDCSGTTVADLGPLAGLSSLLYLDCSNAQVADLGPVAGLSSLQYLDCSQTQVADLGPVAGLSSLQHLDCSGTTVADLTSLAGLSGLRVLNCSNTQVADLAPLANLRKLYRLVCSNTQVSDLEPIAALPSLMFLYVQKSRLRSLPRELGFRRGLLPGDLKLEENDFEPPLGDLVKLGQPEATRSVLAWLRGELDPDSLSAPDDGAGANEPPPLPPPGAGPSVIFAADGRLALAKARDLDSAGNNRKRLESLYPSVREAAIELLSALTAQTTNHQNERLVRVAERYCALIDRPLEEIDFARLYAVGIQLENAERATRSALSAGRVDVPDLGPLQDECIGTLLQLHPSFVLASRDGTEMLADQTLIQMTADDVATVRDSGLAVGNAIIARPDLAEPALGKMIRDAAEEIGQSPNAPRDAVTTISMTRNVVIALGTGATAISLPLVGSALAGPPGLVAGSVGSWVLLKAVEKAKAFSAVQTLFAAQLDSATDADWTVAASRLRGHRALLLSLEGPLRRLARLPQFAWLDRTLDWIKRQPNPPGEP
jgi:Leucine-rich repeat (LRR) protein